MKAGALFIELTGILAKEICQTSKENGFHDGAPNKGEILMHIVTELAEAFEAIRNGNPPDNHCPEFTGEEVELADAVIVILHYAARFDLRLGEAIIAKAEYNKTREFRHGKAF